MGFLSSSVVKNPPAKQETGVQSLGQKDPLEKEMATQLQCSCLENPMDRGVVGVAESDTAERTGAKEACRHS